MPPRSLRPAVDDRIDGVLSSRLSPQHHRMFWYAESDALGGTTPYEALLAGRREAVLELAIGRPGADLSTALISSDEGREIRRRHGHLRPPYKA
jgi:hypothetical protein